MTLVIHGTGNAQNADWGWWDEQDSLAHPLAPVDSMADLHGKVGLAIQSLPRREEPSRTIDAAVRSGSWEGSFAGRCDTACAALRQRMTWTEPDIKLQVGDLGPWGDEPLLEGASPRPIQGAPLAAIGSGTAPAGFDANSASSELLPWNLGVHSRLSTSRRGGLRSSTIGGVGILRAGFAASSDSAAEPLALAGIRLDLPEAQLQASHLGEPGSGAWRILLSTNAASYHQEWEMAHAPVGLIHDRLPASMVGASLVTVRNSWSGEVSQASLEAQARSDSLDHDDLHVLTSLSRDLFGTTLRLRSRWIHREVDDNFCLTPGASRTHGIFRPWGEVALATNAPPRPSTGFRWISRSWHFDASTTLRSTGQWDWKTTSTFERRGTASLELLVAEENENIRGGGTWLVQW